MESLWTSKFMSLVAEAKPVLVEIRDRFVVTVDNNGCARILDASSCQLLHQCAVSERVSACSLLSEHAVLGLEGSAQLRTLQDDLPDGQLARFTAHVTCICVGRSGRTVALGAADFSAKLVELEDGCATDERSFSGHEGPLLTVSLDPSEKFLATAACDGTARVWDTSTAKQLHSWRVQPPCSDTSLAESPCPLRWQEAGGRLLAVPVGCQLQLHAAGGKWRQVATCSSQQLRSAIRCCCWSSCGQFLAAGSNDFTIFAWTVLAADAAVSCQPHSIVKHPALCPLLRLWWLQPDHQQQQQQQQHWLLCLDSKGGVSKHQLLNNQAAASAKQQQQQQQQQQPDQALIDAEAELDGLDANDLVEAFESELLEKEEVAAADGFIDDADASDEAMQEEGGDDDSEQKEEADEDGDDVSEGGGEQDADAADIAKIKSAFRADSSLVPAQLQRPLQSASSSGSSRYLVWNRVGCIIESPPTMSGQARVLSVEFHDSTLHHNVLLANTAGYTLAALSQRALALAAPASDEVLSFVRVRPLAAGAAEWSLPLPKGEDACCLAASDTFVCVGTDRRCVRLVSLHGLQLGLFATAGPLVSLAVTDTAAASVFHSGMPLPGDQCLSADIYDVGSGGRPRLRSGGAGGRVPLTARSSLAWLAFCPSTNRLCAQDTYGCVRLLMPDSSWVQVLSSRLSVQDRTDWIWPVGVSVEKRQLCGVYCRNASQPATSPRPSLQFFNFVLPLCDTGYQDLESQLLLSDQKSLSELQLRLFAQAVKANEESKAQDAAAQMSAKVLQLALQYAGKARKVKLAERLSELMQQEDVQQLQEQQQQQQQAAISPISPNVQPMLKRRKRELDTL